MNHTGTCACCDNSAKIRLNASKALKLDPSGVSGVALAWEKFMVARYKKLAKKILQYIGRDDMLRIQADNPTVNAYSFPLAQAKVKSFETWIKGQLASGEIDITTMTAGGKSGDYIMSAYRKGRIEATKQALKAKGKPIPQADVLASLNAPVHQELLKSVFARNFLLLTGVNQDLANILTQGLTEGLMNGWDSSKIARRMAAIIDSSTKLTEAEKESFKLGRRDFATRLRTIARTESNRATNDARIASYEAEGFTELGVEVEWTTAGGYRVCPICQGKAGKVYSIKESRGLLPAHPNCRCVWTVNIDKFPG
jgi:SPP1 gp7 family putative phage head morphogenesis protein